MLRHMKKNSLITIGRESMTTTEMLPQHTDIPGLKGIGLDTLVKERQKLHLEKARVEKELKEYNSVIKDFMEGCDCPGVAVNGLIVTIVQSRSSRIDKTELLTRGVDPTVIADSTKVTAYSYVKVVA